MLDLVITGGSVVDGTGAPARTADVGVQDGRIVEVGRIDSAARQRIAADGALVTPGWVDIHTHYDGQLTWDPTLAPSSWHGVTTAVVGNCGVGFAPVRPGDESFLIELMEGVEDIPGSALAEGIDWRWEHFPEYLDVVESLPLALDVGTQVPHAAVRAYVLGRRASDRDHEPTDTDIAAMAAIVRAGLEAGALGFSTSRTLLHKDIHGEYVPGTFAVEKELRALGRAMAGLSHGVLEVVSDYLHEGPEWKWITEFCRETGRPATVVCTSPEAYRDGLLFRLTEDANSEGLQIRPQVAGRPTGVLHGLQSSVHLFRRYPSYRAVAELPLAERVALMSKPEFKARILAEASANQASRDHAVAVLWTVFPLGTVPDYEPTREHSVAGIAEAGHSDPLEVMFDLLVADGGSELFYQPLGLYDGYRFDYFEQAIASEHFVFGLSDGGAHCGVIADAGMPTFVLTHWGRDRTRGERVPVETLVRKLSRDTARTYGLDDRGTIEKGMIADLNIIDFPALRLHRPQAVHDLPAGGRRLVQRVDGYLQVIKSGVPILVDGADTGARPGRLIRGGR
jgi:N-acyl-D-aspartate/D-glutamate deacylase